MSRTGSWQRRGSHVTWSAQMYRLYAQDPERFHPSFEAWLDRVHPEDRERVREAVLEASRALGSYEVEHRIVMPDGGVRHLLSVGYCERNHGDGDRDLIGYSTDVTELREVMDQLRATSRKLVNLQEESQRRLATEIHDRVGQLLTAISINLETLRSRIPAEDAPTQTRLEDSIRLVQAATESVVDILGDLRPAVVDELGLVPALQRYAATFQRRTGIDTTLQADMASVRLPDDWSKPLFRIVQEGLMNVAKHAGARHASVRLSCLAGQLRLVIEDDGVGIGLARPSGAPSSGLGLVTTRERVAALGGTFHIGTREKGGTRMEIRLALDRASISTHLRSGVSGIS
jgi:signal transduction histidine kinase